MFHQIFAIKLEYSLPLPQMWNRLKSLDSIVKLFSNSMAVLAASAHGLLLKNKKIYPCPTQHIFYCTAFQTYAQPHHFIVVYCAYCTQRHLYPVLPWNFQSMLSSHWSAMTLLVKIKLQAWLLLSSSTQTNGSYCPYLH